MSHLPTSCPRPNVSSWIRLIVHVCYENRPNASTMAPSRYHCGRLLDMVAHLQGRLRNSWQRRTGRPKCRRCCGGRPRPRPPAPGRCARHQQISNWVKGPRYLSRVIAHTTAAIMTRKCHKVQPTADEVFDSTAVRMECDCDRKPREDCWKLHACGKFQCVVSVAQLLG